MPVHACRDRFAWFLSREPLRGPAGCSVTLTHCSDIDLAGLFVACVPVTTQETALSDSLQSIRLRLEVPGTREPLRALTLQIISPAQAVAFGHRHKRIDVPALVEEVHPVLPPTVELPLAPVAVGSRGHHRLVPPVFGGARFREATRVVHPGRFGELLHPWSGAKPTMTPCSASSASIPCFQETLLHTNRHAQFCHLVLGAREKSTGEQSRDMADIRPAGFVAALRAEAVPVVVPRPVVSHCMPST